MKVISDMNHEIHRNPDAQVWAEEFTKALSENPNIATDAECMATWFANAIMCGYDHCQRKSMIKKPSSEERLTKREQFAIGVLPILIEKGEVSREADCAEAVKYADLLIAALGAAK